MTWQEFKDYVDKRLADMGRDGTIPIWYIEINPLTDDERADGIWVHASIGPNGSPELPERWLIVS